MLPYKHLFIFLCCLCIIPAARAQESYGDLLYPDSVKTNRVLAIAGVEAATCSLSVQGS